jgi:hypothetical protein
MPLPWRPGSRAPASAPANPEGATDGRQPGEPGEILTFGQPERRSGPLSGGIPRPALAAAAAGIIIGVLALAVAVLALRDATSRAPLATRTQRPAAIEVLIASTVSFPLTGTPGALLQVQYLRAVPSQRPSGRPWRRGDCPRTPPTTPPRQVIASTAAPAYSPPPPCYQTLTRT